MGTLTLGEPYAEPSSLRVREILTLSLALILTLTLTLTRILP